MLTHHIFCLVFGAKQFHPILQADQIEQYYLMFYAAINVGALCALVVLILANYSMKAAYAIPVFGFILGFAVFLAFSKRYVRRPPEKAALFGTLGLIGKTAVDCKSFDAYHSEKLSTVVFLINRCLFKAKRTRAPKSIVYSDHEDRFI